jgi:recombination associated protein RdgC
MFKNVTAFQMMCKGTRALFEGDELRAIVGDCPSREPSKMSWRQMGFAHPSHYGESPLFEGAMKTRVFCVRTQERVLPGSAIRTELAKKVASVEKRDNRTLDRRSIAQLKDTVIASMLPKAFIRTIDVEVMITGSWLLLNTASSKAADEVLSFIRDAVYAYYESNSQPMPPMKLLPLNGSDKMSWLRELATGPAADDLLSGNEEDQKEYDDFEDIPFFGHLDNIVLKGNGVVRMKGVEFDSKKVCEAIGDANQVIEIGLGWGEKRGEITVHFTLSDHLVLKRLKFADILVDQARDDSNDEGETAYFDATVAIISEILRELVTSVQQRVTTKEDEEMNKMFLVDWEQKANVTLQDAPKGTDDDDDYEDPFLIEVTRDIQVSGKAPRISTLQRDYRIGYNRAARLLDQMELMGIVTAADANGNRTVTTEQVEDEDDEL